MSMKDRTQANITNQESNRQAEALTDLPVTDEQARQAKGGDTFTVNFTKIKWTYIEQKPE
jgi:hypothetical protein